MKFLTDTFSSYLGAFRSGAQSDDSSEASTERQVASIVGQTHSMRERPRLAHRADPTEVAATLPVLDALARQLRDTAADLQTSVLEISTGFGGMAARARETVQIAQGGLQSEKGLNADQTMLEIRQVLQSLLSSVEDSSQLSSRLAARIGELEEVLSQVNNSLKRVEKISEEARIVGLNGRLEAARAGSHGAAFNVVANETKNLGVHASETSCSIRRHVEQLDISLRSVSGELQSRMSIDAETARRTQETVADLLSQLSLLHHGMTDSLHRTETVSESLSREIGRSVMALQFQDRVNQRLDHVVEALIAIQENLAPFAQAANPQRVQARAADWHRWLESRSTMKSERDLIPSESAGADSGSADCGSVELF